MNTERRIERALAIGESNRGTIELLKNWCAHLQVEKFGGGGILEEQTGLPIGPRSLACPHAAAAGFAGTDLAAVALDFHDRNCVGCVHRKPVGLPNLSILTGERDKKRAAEAAKAARREQKEAAKKAARDAARQALRAGLGPLSANVVDQIVELDHHRNEAVSDGLLETAKLAPEVFTPPVVEYAFTLLESGESWFDDAGLRLLKALNANAPRLTRCALLCIPRYFALRTAAEIVVENVRLVDKGLIAGALPGLISLANPRRFPLGDDDRRQPIIGPLLRLHEAFPETVESGISALLDSRNPYEIGEAARGIAVLARRDRSLPERFARSLASKLVRDRRLLQASELYGGDGDAVNEVRESLALAFEAAPAEVDKLLRAFLLGSSETGEARVFSIYREALSSPRFDRSEITEATRVALKRVIQHATVTERQEVLREIENLLSGGRPYGLTSLAAEEVEALIGAAIVIEQKRERLEGGSPLHDPTGIAPLERYSLQQTLGHLRAMFVSWAAAGAGETRDAARIYSELLESLPAEGRNAVKSDMVRHLDQLMGTTDGMNIALPHLYTAMVGASVALRASAAYAVGELGSRQLDDLPDLVFEAFTALLLDPYRAVHQSAVHALRRLWRVAEAYAPKIRNALLAWILTYGRDRDNDRFLVECLDFYIDHYAQDEFNGPFGDWVLSLLFKIEPYIVASEIASIGRALCSHASLVGLLVRLMLDEIAWRGRHEEITRSFRDLPLAAIRSQTDALEKAIQSPEGQRPAINGLFVEILTRAGAWSSARQVAQAQMATIPDDAWNRSWKLSAQQICVATDFEAALASKAVDRVPELSAKWNAVQEDIEKDRMDNEARRDPLRGLLRQNKSR